jgi:hypothetical protein
LNWGFFELISYTLDKHREERETEMIIKLIVVDSEIDIVIVLTPMSEIVLLGCNLPEVWAESGHEEPFLEESPRTTIAISEWVNMYEYEMDQ